MYNDKPMRKIVLIIGLPGSGKTHFAQKYVEQGFYLIDDPTSIDDNILNCYDNIVITDPFLCNPSIRNMAILKLQKNGFVVECLYFENNPQKAYNLTQYRNKKDQEHRDISLEGMKSFKYEIPNNTITIPIWQPN